MVLLLISSWVDVAIQNNVSQLYRNVLIGRAPSGWEYRANKDQWFHEESGDNWLIMSSYFEDQAGRYGLITIAAVPGASNFLADPSKTMEWLKHEFGVSSRPDANAVAQYGSFLIGSIINGHEFRVLSIETILTRSDVIITTAHGVWLTGMPGLVISFVKSKSTE